MGVSSDNTPVATEEDFLCDMLDSLFCNGVPFSTGTRDGLEMEELIRGFLFCESALPAVEFTFEALFTSFDDSEELELLPIPPRRALNFRLVAFMASYVSIRCSLSNRIHEGLCFQEVFYIQLCRAIKNKCRDVRNLFVRAPTVQPCPTKNLAHPQDLSSKSFKQ